jgi:hypothetical protein
MALSFGLGCSSSGGSGKTSAYKGTFTGAGGDGGSLVVNMPTSSGGGGGPSPQPGSAGGVGVQDIQIQTVHNVTGTAYVGGQTVTLTGTFDDSNNKLTVAGGGYTFSGVISTTGVNGTYVGPKGTGAFTLLSSGNATPYCGTFTGTASGVWNFVTGSGTLQGSYTDSKGNTGTLVGTVDGSNKVTITPAGGGTATGAISGDTATGSWMSSGGMGTWTGSATACGK